MRQIARMKRDLGPTLEMVAQAQRASRHNSTPPSSKAAEIHEQIARIGAEYRRVAELTDISHLLEGLQLSPSAIEATAKVYDGLTPAAAAAEAYSQIVAELAQRLTPADFDWHKVAAEATQIVKEASTKNPGDLRAEGSHHPTDGSGASRHVTTTADESVGAPSRNSSRSSRRCSWRSTTESCNGVSPPTAIALRKNTNGHESGYCRADERGVHREPG
jgi:hypothetical protein